MNTMTITKQEHDKERKCL